MADLILDAEELLSKWGFSDGDILSNWWWDFNNDDPPFLEEEHDVLFSLVETYLVPVIKEAGREIEIYRIHTNHNPVRASTLDGVNVDDLSRDYERFQPPVSVTLTGIQVLDHIRDHGFI